VKGESEKGANVLEGMVNRSQLEVTMNGTNQLEVMVKGGIRWK